MKQLSETAMAIAGKRIFHAGFIVCLLYAGLLITPSSVHAAAAITSCRITQDYASCWNDTSLTNCAYSVDLNTDDIDTQQVFCYSGNLGKSCKYAKESVTCTRESTNPIQEAVLYTSGKNNAISPKSIRWEVFLEPGEYPIQSITQTATPLTRYGVRVPSYTQITGAIAQNALRASVYIPQSVYENLANGACKDVKYWRGNCIHNLFRLSNVSDLTISGSKNLYQAYMANPISNVVIRYLYLLGVGGPGMRSQTVDEAQKKSLYDSGQMWYCTDIQCFYKYTASIGIMAPRVQGRNVRISHNSIQMFPATAIKLNQLFYDISQKDITDGADNDPFAAYMKAEGEPDDPIRIEYNRLHGNLRDGLVSLHGSYIDVVGNTLWKGFNDYTPGNIAISPWGDSHHIRVLDNTMDGFITGANFEAMLFTAEGGNDEFLYDMLYASDRVGRDNEVRGNTMTNVLNCVSIQRQKNFTFSDNTCFLDSAKSMKLATLDYYVPDYVRLNQATRLGYTDVSQYPPDVAMRHNNSINGVGIFVRTSQGTTVANNTFNGFYRPIDMRSLHLIPGGMKDNTYNRNTFSIGFTDLVNIINNAKTQGLSDTYFTLYWPAGDQESSGNRYCADNISEFPAHRLFSIASSNNIATNAVCAQVTTPTSTPTNTLPSPTQHVASPTPTALADKPGDANGDGLVDEADYTIWKSSYGQTVTGVANGDFNGDGKTDGVDYIIWLDHYGE